MNKRGNERWKQEVQSEKTQTDKGTDTYIHNHLCQVYGTVYEG